MSVAEDLTQPSFPRSVLLALWLNSVQAHPDIEPNDLITAVEDIDEPHRLLGTASTPAVPTAEQEPLLRTAMSHWRTQPLRAAALLPAPGDPGGLPPGVSPSATTAGECVLLRLGDRDIGLVPEVEVFGSIYEQGFHVSWTAHDIDPWENRFLGAVGSLQDAERSLRRALTTATEALTSLDVARWRDDAADAIHALGTAASEPERLPPSLGQRQVQVLILATRLRSIVDLATDDDGGAVNLWQADQRGTALREVDYAARHAMAAATLPPPAQ